MLWLLAALCLPEQPAYYVACDHAIVNRVRTFSTEFDDWGRPRWTPQQTVWISFYDRLPCLGIAGHYCIVSRGWWTIGQLRSINPCTEGWILESNDGVNVITDDVRFVNSSFDWEMKTRRMFRPIRKP